MRIKLTISITTLIIVLCSCNNDVDNLSKAKEEFNNGYYSTAIKYCNLGIVENSENFEAYYCRGLSHYRLGNIDNCLKDLDSAILILPSYIVAIKALAGVKYEIEDYNGAIDVANLLLSHNPSSLKALELISTSKRKLEDYNGTIFYSNKILDIDPNNLKALINRGLAFAEIGQYSKSFNDFTIIINTASGNDDWIIDILSTAYYNRAVIYYNKSNYEEMSNDLLKSAELGNQNAKLLIESLNNESEQLIKLHIKSLNNEFFN